MRLIALLALLMPLVAGTAPAADVKSDAVVAQLMTTDLSGLDGKEVVMLTVEYLPGGASMPHRHYADVFGYVLEGKLRTQVDGQEPVTLAAGQSFHEGPADIHRVSANASQTEPVKFLVVIVKDKGKDISRPVTGKQP